MNNPKNLYECIDILTFELSEKDIEYIKNIDNTARLHHTLGRRIRNRWGFWGKSELKNYFKNLGIFHPDDMSGIILESFYRHIRNKPIDLEGQVKYYQNYWKKAKEQYGE